MDLHVDPKCIKNKYSCPSTDTWSLGVLLARILVYVNLGEHPNSVDKAWIANIKKEQRLPLQEKEVL